MNTKEAYKQKMEAEVEVAQAKLAELKAHAKSLAADAHIKYAKQADNLEHGVESIKAKLKELDEAGEDNWERFKDGLESAWGKVVSAVNDTVAKFKH